MLKCSSAFAAGAAILIAATTPAFAGESLTLRSMLVADIGRDVDAISAGKVTSARIVRSVPAEMPAFEKLANIGGTASIQIELDGSGAITRATVRASSGNARIDQSALSAVRAATYQSATVNGKAVGGSYVVDVWLDPAS